jgi:hypothetical protein
MDARIANDIGYPAYIVTDRRANLAAVRDIPNIWWADADRVSLPQIRIIILPSTAGHTASRWPGAGDVYGSIALVVN